MWVIKADPLSNRRFPIMRAIADALRAVGGAIATVVSLPFRLVAKLFGGASRGGGRARRA
ncbi:hypothetical protein GCM10011583_68570 [Streptomyces camponoticapitis]|uniref:Uncharacterized protein n=1 Tax=Streptomyces camponoticapitis TaxID=1616125 RepID=A0ABQ2EUF0_9ACTN|nr:hypothetical protein GCM10011583_68570 [Streptomyces camponoticapitis]